MRSTTRIWFSLLLLTCLTVTESAFAQDVQVPFDSEDNGRGELYLIDADIREDLELFPEYPTFESAVLYRTDTGIYRLEVSYREGKYTVRRSEPLDSVGVALLRRDIWSKLSGLVTRPHSLLDQSGRSHFLWTIAVASLAWYAPSVVFALGLDDVDAATSTYLVSAGAGFFVPYFITENSVMTDGMAAGARVGAVLGFIHAGQLFGSFGFFDNASDEDMRVFMGITSLASIAEMGLGLGMSQSYNISDGRMNLMGVGGVFGAFGGQAWSQMIFGDNLSSSSVALISLAGSAAGIYSANQLGLSSYYTTGDAKALMIAGIVGTGLAASIMSYGASDMDSRLMSGVMMGAGLVSCIATHRWLERRDLRDMQGNYMILGATGGAFFGFAASGAMRSKDPESAALAAGIGAALGFGIVTLTLDGSTGRKSSNDFDGSRDRGSLDFELNPGALAMAATRSSFGHGRSSNPISVPVASISYTF